MKRDWFYAKDGAQKGPVGIEELKSLRVSGQVGQDDLVWREGMDDWLPYRDVAELSVSISGIPPVGASGVGGAPRSTSANQVYAPPGSASIAGGGAPGVVPPTYLWQSIVCNLLCCLPFGIPGIVYASKVDSLARAGDLMGAQDASHKAKFWCWMSFGFGLGFSILYLILVAAGGLA